MAGYLGRSYGLQRRGLGARTLGLLRLPVEGLLIQRNLRRPGPQCRRVGVTESLGGAAGEGSRAVVEAVRLRLGGVVGLLGAAMVELGGAGEYVLYEAAGGTSRLYGSALLLRRRRQRGWGLMLVLVLVSKGLLGLVRCGV